MRPSPFTRLAFSGGWPARVTCPSATQDARNRSWSRQLPRFAISQSHAIVLVNLALASVQLGDLDAAAGRLHEATIDLTELNWGGGGLNIIFTAGRALLPWRTAPVVRDVHDRLLGLMAATQGT